MKVLLEFLDGPALSDYLGMLLQLPQSELLALPVDHRHFRLHAIILWYIQNIIVHRNREKCNRQFLC